MGAGPQLLLLHGAGGATQSWRHLLPVLAQHFKVTAVDLPGQGFTRLGAQRRCGMDTMAEDIATLVRQEDWKPVALIGHSAGAAVALRLAELATQAPPVIGINAALSNFKGLAGVLFPIMAKGLAMTPWIAQLFTASTRRPQSVVRLIEGTGSTLNPEDLDYYRRLVSDPAHVNATLAMMAQWDLGPLLSRLNDHPSATLLITGEKDKAVPPETSVRVAKQMLSARVVSMPGLGHLAHEEDGSGVAQHIFDFLKIRAKH